MRLRRATVLLTTLAATLGGLLTHTAHAAPADYTASVQVGKISADAQTIPVSATLTCPAGETLPLRTTAYGVRTDYAGPYGSGSSIGGWLVTFDDLPYDGEGHQLVTCTGTKQAVTGLIRSSSTPLTFVYFRAGRKIQLTTELGAVTVEQVVNLKGAYEDVSPAGYSISNIKIGTISADRRRVPVWFDYTCPAGEQPALLMVGYGFKWESRDFPDRVITGAFLGGLGPVTCTGTRQEFVGSFSPPSAMIQFPGTLLPTRSVRILVQLGPISREQLVNVR